MILIHINVKDVMIKIVIIAQIIKNVKYVHKDIIYRMNIAV